MALSLAAVQIGFHPLHQASTYAGSQLFQKADCCPTALIPSGKRPFSLPRRNRTSLCRAQAKPISKGGRGIGGGQTPTKKPHKIEKLDVSKVAGVETFQVFARLEKDKDDVTRFKPIAELLVETGGDVAKALKERRRQLVELAREIIEYANVPDTALQYAFQKSPKKGDRHDLDPTTISVGGPLEGDSVPAILRSADKSGLKLYDVKDRSYAPAPTTMGLKSQT